MQAALVEGVLESLRIGVGFLWTAAWAIIMGLVITRPVQVYRLLTKQTCVQQDRLHTGPTPRHKTMGGDREDHSVAND